MYAGSIPAQASIATFGKSRTGQTGAVIQPMTVAALTVVATTVIATATRALRFTKNRMLSNMAKLPPDVGAAPQVTPHASAYEALIGAG